MPTAGSFTFLISIHVCDRILGQRFVRGNDRRERVVPCLHAQVVLGCERVQPRFLSPTLQF